MINSSGPQEEQPPDLSKWGNRPDSKDSKTNGPALPLRAQALDGQSLAITYRGNDSYSPLIKSIADMLKSYGCRVKISEFPPGTPDEIVGVTIKRELPDLTRDRLLITDQTVARQLEKNLPSVLSQTIDDLIQEELRVLLKREKGLEGTKQILAAEQDDFDTANRLLATHGRIFGSLIREALNTAPPDRVVILPHYMGHHEPFLQNLKFFLTYAISHNSIADEQRKEAAACLNSLVQSLCDKPADTRLPSELTEAISSNVGYKFLQPHELVREALKTAGISEEQITVLEQSRGAITAPDIETGGKVWVFSDRHAYLYGINKHKQKLQAVVDRAPNALRLRLPLEDLLFDLYDAGLVSFEHSPPQEMLAEQCARRLAEVISRNAEN